MALDDTLIYPKHPGRMNIQYCRNKYGNGNFTKITYTQDQWDVYSQKYGGLAMKPIYYQRPGMSNMGYPSMFMSNCSPMPCSDFYFDINWLNPYCNQYLGGIYSGMGYGYNPFMMGSNFCGHGPYYMTDLNMCVTMMSYLNSMFDKTFGNGLAMA